MAIKSLVKSGAHTLFNLSSTCAATCFVCFFVVDATIFAQFDESSLEFFENEVRPILVEHCGQCHSKNSEGLQGGLSVESRASLVAGGDTGPAIVPGDPSNSLLIDAINYRGIYEMPPSSKLPDEKIKVLEEWVRLKAPWPKHDEAILVAEKEFDLNQRRSEHWAWQPIQHRPVPEVDNSNWPLDPIDNFVLEKLEEHRISPAVDCDKRTWIRRVWFDLIGMPPEPADIDAFLSDDSEQAYERVVDDLLMMPGFGERWARHWMDLVRYAETYGHEFDFPIEHAYQYRDYLIRAFNEDLPYNDFIREHIAGDLIENPRMNPTENYNESVLGTGFWFLGEATHGPVDVKADEAGRIDNQIDVMCKSFVGLTVACARCHDHKFDAISADDYYALAGFLQSSRRQIALLDRGGMIKQSALSTEAVVADAGSLVSELATKFGQISSEEWVQELQLAINGSERENANSKNASNESGEPNFDFRTLSNWRPLSEATHPLHLLQLALADDISLLKFQINEYKGELKKQAKQYDQFIDQSELYEEFSNGIPDDWFMTGWAIDGPKKSLGLSIAGNIASANSMVSSGRLGAKFRGALRSPTFVLTHDRIAIRAKGSSSNIRLIIDGYEMDIHNPLLFAGCKLDLVNENQFVWINLDADIKNYKGHRAYLEFNDLGDGFFQVAEIRFLNNGDADPVDPPNAFSELAMASEPVNREQCLAAIGESFTRFFNADEKVDSLERSELMSLLTEYSVLGNTIIEARESVRRKTKNLPAPMLAIAMADGTPENENLFIRGNSKTLGDVVPRRFLTALSTSEKRENLFESGSGRMFLADQIASSNNPLTGRVVVNRIWRHLMGEGIVRSVDNFGVLGQTPSHPKLLDFLATQFFSDGWSVKQMIRRIVLSRTYRMSSLANAAAKEIDPDNRLLHRVNVKRLEGEAIRDSILKVAGSLNSKMYGPSVAVHLTDFMQGRGRPRASGPVDGKGRRSIYIEVRRNFLPPMMLAFDTPIPFNTIGDRHQSNVPAQALILMNDPFVYGQAGEWAKKIMTQSTDNRGRIQTVFLQAFGRLPTSEESNDAVKFLESQAKDRGIDAADADENSGIWQDFCHVAFNMKEFIYVK